MVFLITLLFSFIIPIGMAVAGVIGSWKTFEKAGIPGWTALIPIYSSYKMFEMVYGNGWKFLYMLIPIYNIYVMIKFYIDLAAVFDQGIGFAVGLLLLNMVFICILGFSPNIAYMGSQDGTISARGSVATVTRLSRRNVNGRFVPEPPPGAAVQDDDMNVDAMRQAALDKLRAKAANKQNNNGTPFEQ